MAPMLIDSYLMIAGTPGNRRVGQRTHRAVETVGSELQRLPRHIAFGSGMQIVHSSASFR